MAAPSKCLRRLALPAQLFNRMEPVMSSNRHVPIITGAVALGLAAWLLFAFSGWWRYIPATLLLGFGWVSIKTALFASQTEIDELTGTGPASADTWKKFQDRL